MKILPDGTVEGTPDEIAQYSMAKQSRRQRVRFDICSCNPKNGGDGTCHCGLSQQSLEIRKEL